MIQQVKTKDDKRTQPEQTVTTSLIAVRKIVSVKERCHTRGSNGNNNGSS